MENTMMVNAYMLRRDYGMTKSKSDSVMGTVGRIANISTIRAIEKDRCRGSIVAVAHFDLDEAIKALQDAIINAGTGTIAKRGVINKKIILDTLRKMNDIH
jgi:hypothetical protein